MRNKTERRKDFHSVQRLKESGGAVAPLHPYTTGNCAPSRGPRSAAANKTGEKKNRKRAIALANEKQNREKKRFSLRSKAQRIGGRSCTPPPLHNRKLCSVPRATLNGSEQDGRKKKQATHPIGYIYIICVME